MPYCLLMDGLAKAGSIREAKAVFDEMKEKNIRSGMFPPFRFEFINRKQNVLATRVEKEKKDKYLFKHF